MSTVNPERLERGASEKSSITVTCALAAHSSLTTFMPMKPAPPVTKALLPFHLIYLSSRSDTTATTRALLTGNFRLPQLEITAVSATSELTLVSSILVQTSCCLPLASWRMAPTIVRFFVRYVVPAPLGHGAAA